MKYAFYTVTDYSFFPGTLATVNSVLHFHHDTRVYVIYDQSKPLVNMQIGLLSNHPHVKVLSSETLAREGRHMNTSKALKAYACHDLSGGYDVIIGIDSDCLLCSSVEQEVVRVYNSKGFLGGRDTEFEYRNEHRVYGISLPARNRRYMSTSLFFCAVTPHNRQILSRWVDCCSDAIFNHRDIYPGYGDQPVLNAILFAVDRSSTVRLLPNKLWSQHHVYWNTVMDFQAGSFINLSADGQRQRAFHACGKEKFWTQLHQKRILGDYSKQVLPYVWFVAMLWFGACRDWSVDPCEYVPVKSLHLIGDLRVFLPQIFNVHPEARFLWDQRGSKREFIKI